MAENNQQIQTNVLGTPEMPQPAPEMPQPESAPAPQGSGRPAGSGRKRGRPVGSRNRHPRGRPQHPVPPPPPSSWKMFCGGDSQELTAMLKSGEDLSNMLESVALKESRVLRVNSAQGRLSLVNLAGPSSACPISYQGRWEILSLSGVIVPGNKVGNHPIGGVSIGFVGQTGEAIVGRIGGRVIADTALMVSMTAYELSGETNAKRRRGPGPRVARPVPSTGGVLALPDVHETERAAGEEQVIAGPSNARHGVASDQEVMPSAAGPSD